MPTLFICICLSSRLPVCLPIYLFICVCVYRHTHTHTHIYIYIHTHTHTQRHNLTNYDVLGENRPFFYSAFRNTQVSHFFLSVHIPNNGLEYISIFLFVIFNSEEKKKSSSVGKILEGHLHPPLAPPSYALLHTHTHK
jgi:hypothetical protein